MVAGHTHNRLDNANSKPRQRYYSISQIETIVELEQAFRTAGPKYFSKSLKPIYDFSSELSKIIDDKAASSMTITKCHQVKVNHLGIFTKEFDEEVWSGWRGRSPSQGSNIEPLQLINKDHEVFCPSFVKYNPFSEQRMQKMTASYSNESVLRETIDKYCQRNGSFHSLVANEETAQAAETRNPPLLLELQL